MTVKATTASKSDGNGERRQQRRWRTIRRDRREWGSANDGRDGEIVVNGDRQKIVATARLSRMGSSRMAEDKRSLLSSFGCCECDLVRCWDRLDVANGL